MMAWNGKHNIFDDSQQLMSQTVLKTRRWSLVSDSTRRCFEILRRNQHESLEADSVTTFTFTLRIYLLCWSQELQHKNHENRTDHFNIVSFHAFYTDTFTKVQVQDKQARGRRETDLAKSKATYVTLIPPFSAHCPRSDDPTLNLALALFALVPASATRKSHSLIRSHYDVKCNVLTWLKLRYNGTFLRFLPHNLNNKQAFLTHVTWHK